MLKKLFLLAIAGLLLTGLANSYAHANKLYIAGIADGFPPYQFINAKQQTDGFDADVLRLLFQRMGKEFTFQQMKWEDVVGSLMFTDELDCIAGMEITPIRQKHFDFTSSYHFRKSALFVLADNNEIQQLNDLIRKKIAGDKDSALEKQLKEMGLAKEIRIKHTKSKEQSMHLLKNGEFSALIAPQEVGLYLAKKLYIKVKIIAEVEYGTPVAIAVKKGNLALRNRLDGQLQRLIQEGEIKKLHNAWFN